MDTPTCPPPKDGREQAILDQLVLIRDKLLLLKADRTKYIRTQEVLPLYQDVIDQVRQLNEVRSGRSGIGTEENRVDRVLDSCFQLLSLFFMTIGRNNEAPAAYALTSTIKRLLDHLSEVGFFSAKDLESLNQTLDRLAKTVKASPADNPLNSPYLSTLLCNRVDSCRKTITELERKLDRLAEPLMTIWEKCISCLRSLSLANTRSEFSPSEVKKLQAQLKELDDLRTDGKFLAPDGELLAGSDEVSEFLDKCLMWSNTVLERRGVIPEPFRATYDTLVAMRNNLEKLTITQAWSLRETDLYDLQRQLDKIDESRVDGNFLDDQGRPAELYVQRTLLYLLRRSYAYIYSLMISSEPVSEALLPIYNQLQTLKRCLVEVKNSGGVTSVRELYPYSMKLNSIDNMRTDGKFMVGDDIPEGQGSVNELLAECFDISYELRVAAENEAEANGQE